MQILGKKAGQCVMLFIFLAMKLLTIDVTPFKLE
nr:MAG TPA: ATPase [Caudoviricetes sp.]